MLVARVALAEGGPGDALRAAREIVAAPGTPPEQFADAVAVEAAALNALGRRNEARSAAAAAKIPDSVDRTQALALRIELARARSDLAALDALVDEARSMHEVAAELAGRAARCAV